MQARPKRGDGHQERQVAGVRGRRRRRTDELIRVHHYQQTFLFPFFLFDAENLEERGTGCGVKPFTLRNRAKGVVTVR